jgi:hypothetical protein
MSNMFNKEMAHPRCSHRLAKASILSDLKQYQYVKETYNLVNRHVWYTVCTPRQKQIERQTMLEGAWHGRSGASRYGLGQG